MSIDMSHLNSNFDDYDSFLDLDNDFTSQSTSPAVKTNLMLTPQSSSAHTFATSSAPPTFPQPSFDYTSHHQQTGFTSGALANTIAVNKAAGLQYYEGNGGFVMPTETLNIPLTNLDEFDFARPDLDFETDSPVLFSEQPAAPGQFVSPNNLVTPYSSVPTRIYPGMHSQQAAQAKAQQAQKQQMIRQQQQPSLPQGQKPLPSPTKMPLAKDPLVEESISKVLNRMRHASVSSAGNEVDMSATPMGNLPRIKKDEDEMDEDEKLLASEEGKKLSSKERRQLRNKVSARAFRSRRKEYIGQLEGEVAAKVQEANELRQLNEQLREENNRLTDLTRMLLSSQAFAGFLQELSESGLPQNHGQASAQQQKRVRPQPQAQAQAQPQPRQKDVNVHDTSIQSQMRQPQVGMALIPEPQIDLSAVQTSHAWMNNMPATDFKVFAVTELPLAPVLDLEALSQKSTFKSSRSSKASRDQQKDLPQIPAIPSLSGFDRTRSPVTLNKADSCLQDAATTNSSSQESSLTAEQQLAELENICKDMDETSARLGQFTSHF